MDSVARSFPPTLVNEFQICDDVVRIEGDFVVVAGLVVVESDGVRLGITGARFGVLGRGLSLRRHTSVLET